jgi:hypothetical protein
LEELDEKVALVNNQTGLPPFKEVPPVAEFNQEVEGNLQKKSLMFVASVIPCESDGSFSFTGLNQELINFNVIKAGFLFSNS